MSEPAVVLREIGRVLQPGGRLLLHTDLDSPLRRLHKVVRPGRALLHPHSLSIRWIRDAKAGLVIDAERRDPEVFRPKLTQMRSEAFWDGVALRITRSERWTNHVWLTAMRKVSPRGARGSRGARCVRQ